MPIALTTGSILSITGIANTNYPDELVGHVIRLASWHEYILITILSRLRSALWESTLAYLPIAYARYRRTSQRRNRSYIDYALAAALSLVTQEFTWRLRAARTNGSDTWFTGGGNAILSICSPLLFTLLVAFRATRRDCYGDSMSWLAVVGPSVLLRGVGGLTESFVESHWMGVLAARVAIHAFAAFLVFGEWLELGYRDSRTK